MSDSQGLLDAIRERPDEDLPRLALADWCMEQPAEATQARGEFIQLRCQAARLAAADPARWDLDARARQLRDRYEAQWLGPVAGQADGWDYDRGLVVVELRAGFSQRLSLAKAMSDPAWFWVIGVKGVLLDLDDVRRLAASAAAERITSLDLSDCGVTADEVRAVALQGRFVRLSRLHLSYARLGDDGAEALAKSSLDRLTVLSLFAARVGPTGARALANAAGLKRLASLDLGHNRLGQQGARAIAACGALSDLTTLSLSGCQIGDRGAAALIDSTALGKLDRLDATDNGLSAGAKEELRQRFGARAVV